MAFEIVLSKQAHQDRIDILQYWINRNQSKVYSIQLNEIFIATFNSISIYPRMGRMLGIKNFRVRIVRDYLVVYLIDVDSVNIVTIWDGRRNPADLKERLLK